MIQKSVFQIMKTSNFGGDLLDISARKEVLITRCDRCAWSTLVCVFYNTAVSTWDCIFLSIFNCVFHLQAVRVMLLLLFVHLLFTGMGAVFSMQTWVHFFQWPPVASTVSDFLSHSIVLRRSGMAVAGLNTTRILKRYVLRKKEQLLCARNFMQPSFMHPSRINQGDIWNCTGWHMRNNRQEL